MIFFVIERGAGGEEIACIYRDRLMADTKRRAVYMLRVDKLPPAEQEYWLSRSCTELLDEGKLPPSNIADPPRKADGGRKGSLRGEETWWKPASLPHGQDWTST